MARDGSGNYNLPAGNPVVTGTVISSTQFNSTMQDVGQALTQSLTKDGQTTPTGNLPMGGNKHTSVADGNLGNQYASINQTQNGSLTKLTAVANAGDAYTGSLTPAIAGYTDGQVVYGVASATSTTTSPTLAINGLAARPIQKENGATCVPGDIALSVPMYLVYFAAGGYFLLLNPQKITGSRVLGLPDGSLSSNVPLKNVANSFSSANTFTAPAASNAIIASGAANAQTMIVSGAAAAGQSFGLFLAAGTNASDTALTVLNQAQTLQYLAIAGNGAFTFGNTTNNPAYNFLGTGTTTFGGKVQINGGAIAVPLQLDSTAANGASFALSNSATIYGNLGSAKAVMAVTFSASDLVLEAAGNLYLAATGAATPAAKLTSTNVQIVDETATLQDAGFRGLPQNIQNGSYTTVMADRGKHILNASAGAVAYVIPSNASVAYPIGTTLTFVNETGALASTIAITSDTLVFIPGNTTGTRTMAPGCMATALKITATRWFISGPGLT